MNHHTLKKTFHSFSICLFVLSFTLTTPAAENLRVEKMKSPSGEVASAWINTMDHKTYISGIVRLYLPVTPTIGAHVHVELLGKNGELIQYQTDRLSAILQRRTSSTHHRSYVVSFPVGETRKASQVRVIYFNKSHTSCDTCRDPEAG
jgi:hypothetical protein